MKKTVKKYRKAVTKLNKLSKIMAKHAYRKRIGVAICLPDGETLTPPSFYEFKRLLRVTSLDHKVANVEFFIAKSDTVQ